MSKNKFALAGKIAPRILICVVLLMSANRVLCDTDDDDTTLEFYWDAASGSVAHYNVYLYIDGEQHTETWTTATPPSADVPYVVPIVAEDGRMYQLQVQAEDANNETGPMSELSDPVWCKLRSPGYEGGSSAGDADGDLRVGVGDWAILSKAMGTQRGEASFDYRADFNYDHSVNQLDVNIITSSWGNIYN